jgi:hypothetical protein
MLIQSLLRSLFQRNKMNQQLKYLIKNLILFICLVLQSYACGSLDNDDTDNDYNQRPKIVRRIEQPVRRTPTTQQPKIVKDEFKASCTSNVKGCEELQKLKSQISNYDDFFTFRAKVLYNDLKTLIEALNQAKYVYPEFSVALEWVESPQSWRSISGEKKSNVILKTKYKSWENAFYPEDLQLIKKAYQQLDADLKYFKTELKNIQSQGFEVQKLSSNVKPLAEDVTFSITTTATEVYQFPKVVLSSFEMPKPHTAPLKIAIVNSEFDLNYHIVEEKDVAVLIQPFIITDHLLVMRSSMIDSTNIPFDVPTEAICKSLRVEARIEKPNEDVLYTMKIIKDENSIPKNEDKITFASTQASSRLSTLEEEAKKLKEKNIMLEVAKLLTEPNPNAMANAIKKDGSFDGWDFPSKNISPSDLQIVNLLRELKPQAPLEKKLCVSIDNKQALSLQTSESSLPMILDILNIPQNVLLPEETLSITWNEKNNKNSMVGEKEDFGPALFDVLKKKKEAVLKFNQAVKTIPYMIHLQTDTGSKINLPVEIDGLKSKQTLAANTKWKLLGVAEQFAILESSVYHQKLLSKVIDDGSVKLFDIQYERSFPEYLTDWQKIREYEVHLSGNRENFLGYTEIKQYFRQVVKKTENCDIEISFEFKTIRKEDVNQKAKENQSLVKKSILHIPNPTDQYVFSFVDAPNCQ